MGCDPEEPVPGYLYIPAIDLEVNSNGTQGSDAHDIVDAWVYVEGKSIGVFELPARIPILAEGEQSVIVLAGVKKNGMANDRIPYPFFEPFETTVNFKPAQIDTLEPVVQYNENVVFPWLEDFEDQTLSLEGSGASTTVDSMYIVSDPTLVYGYDAVKNRYSAGVEIDTGYQIFENSSVQLFDLPRSGREVFLEFNYKTDAELVAGFYPIGGNVVAGIPVVNFFPTTEWKKAYVSLKEDINVPEFQDFLIRITFRSESNTEEQTPKIYLDNIKLVHFES